MLRVRADIVDRLVNEAGEVAIARARIEGELRSLKSNLLELTNSVIRLRSAGARNRAAGGNADPVADVLRRQRPSTTSIRSSSIASRASRS